MAQEELRIGKHTFQSRTEYEEALKDLAFIRVIKRENDIKDPKVAKDVYDRLRFQEGVLKTVIGKDFFYELSSYIAEGERQEKELKLAMQEAESSEDRENQSVSRFVWPSDMEKEENEEKSGSDKRTKLLIVIAASLIVLIFCVAKLVSYEFMTMKSTQDIAELKALIGESDISIRVDKDAADFAYTVISNGGASKNTDGVLDKYEDLYRMNEDIVGWVSIEDTNIDYPVMQNFSDREYYLHRGYDKQDSDEGLPFLDFRCTSSPVSSNLLIYGHNMKNGHMFADLMKYEKEEFFRGHRLIRYDTIYEEGYYDIVAVFRTKVSYEDENVFKFYDFIQADNEAEFDEYIEGIKRLALYETGVSASYGDQLISLTTCEYTVDDGRFVVVAKKIN